MVHSPSLIETQKPVTSTAEKTMLPMPLSVEEARDAAKTAFEPRERTAIILALLANPPASAEALNLATQIAAQANKAYENYTAARDAIDSKVQQKDT